MRPSRSLIALAAALLVTLAVAAPAASAKKKGTKGKRGGSVDVTKAAALPIPDRGPGATSPFGLLTSTIEVGMKFKGKRIRDVNVTVQTTGATGIDQASDVTATLTAPNGATATLFSNLEGPLPNSSIGPLTLDDDVPLLIGQGAPLDPTRLFAPWAGVAQPFRPLWVMDDGGARGTWTLRVTDTSFGGGSTSVLNSWRLQVQTGKPFRTK